MKPSIYMRIPVIKTENNKELIDKVLEMVEKEFDTQHFCSCEKWCDCWDKFKEKVHKELGNRQ